MKLLFSIICVIMLSLSFFQKSDAATDSTTLNSSSINSTVTLHRSTTYYMKGFNYVNNGAVLIIEAGTKIFGDYDTKGTLIIQRGGKIIADANAGDPILFTSRQPAGQRSAGDWGGVIILGRSGINTVTGADSAEIEGFGAGQGPIYGGQPRIDDDSSGVLRYVRIEFAGVNLTGISGNEINGLTMGGVGSRTVIDYVQVSYSGDDSYEWFGGTVTCKHLVAFKGLDDDWDTDNGFRGKIQFCLSVRDSGIVDVSTSNGFESDNNVNTPVNFNSPRTHPIFSNMTVIGPYASTSWSLNSLWGRGGHIRRNSLMCAYNSIIMAWKVGLRFDGSGVGDAATGDTLQIRNTILAGNVRLADSTGTGSFSPQQWLQTPAFANTVFATSASVQLTAPFDIYPEVPLPADNVNDWMPLSGSPALSGASFSNPNLAGFEVVNYVGAFGTTNWTSGWTQFNPKNYTIIGITQLSSIVPDKFSLEQNFPNPFNPSTIINYELRITNYVTLKVYNSLGKEVVSLVNQRQNAGSYSVDFNAANLPSGIYYYTLKTDGISETKKMMLLK
jgi:Secretion system C-terminal sorting domain